MLHALLSITSAFDYVAPPKRQGLRNVMPSSSPGSEQHRSEPGSASFGTSPAVPGHGLGSNAGARAWAKGDAARIMAA